MYRVVGCRDCGALWIVADRPETTRCPRCGTRHRLDRLHAFYEADDAAAARAARTALLAERAGGADRPRGPEDVEAVRGSEADHLEGVGIDAAAVAEAGARATSGPPKAAAKRETVIAALEALDRPTEAEVVGYAADRDVPPEAVADVLEKLVRAGEVSESGGRYRRV